jgi:energy-coupling factor transporter ATP-binding protein EcfA2
VTRPGGFYVPAFPLERGRPVATVERPNYGQTDFVIRDAQTETARENRRLARLSTEAPRIPWNIFVERVFQWKNGQHVGLIGPTGQGKTTLLLNMLPLHPYVVVFATKPKDDTIDKLVAEGYYHMERWQSMDSRQYPRRVLWPNATRMDSTEHQAEVFHHALGAIYREGGWTVALDETWYVINVLKLGQDVKTYLLQARSLGISLVCATQRPANVPLEIYDQSSHLFFWRDNDESNLRRISGISWRSSELIRTIVANLEEFQVLYVNTRTGRMVRTRCPLVT